MDEYLEVLRFFKSHPNINRHQTFYIQSLEIPRFWSIKMKIKVEGWLHFPFSKELNAQSINFKESIKIISFIPFSVDFNVTITKKPHDHLIIIVWKTNKRNFNSGCINNLLNVEHFYCILVVIKPDRNENLLHILINNN